jgi:DNA-binding response OmpR family regulator
VNGPRPLRIVVADDDHDTADTLTALLRAEGHEARVLYDGQHVPDAVRDFGPDAVLLDIGMPGISGYEVASELRKQYGSATPMLIAVTGWTKGWQKQLGQRSGFDHYVEKPYDSRHLLNLLQPLSENAL